MDAKFTFVLSFRHGKPINSLMNDPIRNRAPRTLDSNMAANRNLLSNLDLTQVLRETQHHIQCWTRIDITATQQGSRMRRPSPEGVGMWTKEFLKANGFDGGFRLRAYLNWPETSEGKEAQAIYDKACEDARKVFEEGKQPVPTDGPFIDQPLITPATVMIVDGGHRSTSLRDIIRKKMTETGVGMDHESLKAFRWVPCIMYGKGLEAEGYTPLLSKAVNDQVSMSVKEDALERLTFVASLIPHIKSTLKEGEDLTATMLARWYLKRTGAKLDQKDVAAKSKSIKRQNDKKQKKHAAAAAAVRNAKNTGCCE